MREHALSYKDSGNCIVETCIAGFHPDGSKCEPNVIACDMLNADGAERTWNYTNMSYSACKITKCKDGYHLDANSCIPNNKNCDIKNGTGTAVWNEKTGTWDKCIVESCEPGYTTDKTETLEVWEQCGRCNNMYAENGDIAVSSYTNGCEIASCMYQGQKYILENNECRLICDSQSDETGSRRWDTKSETCVQECNNGYTQW
jgi:hypothetical protein